MEHRKITSKEQGRGVTFEIHEYEKIDTSAISAAPNLYYARQTGMTLKQLCIRLEGGGATLQAGALQYYHGNVTMQTRAHAPGGGVGGFLNRAMQSRGTGESKYINEFTGTGEVWTEPSFKHLLVGRIDDPRDSWLVDDGMFYAAESGITVAMHVHTNVGVALLGGNGLAQPKLTGVGAFVLESPVPPEEIHIVDLQGGELKVDGDLVVMYQSTLTYTVEKSQRGLLATAKSGEGLLHVYRGTGQVWVAPTLGLAGTFGARPTTTSH